MKTKTRQLDLQEKTHTGVDKVARYNWKIRNQPGEFHMLKKQELSIDHSYQRSKINVRRVDEMARSWDWVACGALVVSLREDNSWFVIDGQHRKLAADKRSDIREIPCLVFDSETVRDEALGFLSINTGKVGVAGLDRFHAMVTAGDKAAVEVSRILNSTGHKVGASNSAKTVSCVITLLNLFKEDEARFRSIWSLISDMHPSGPIINTVAKGVWMVDKWVSKNGLTATQSPYRERLLELGGESASGLIQREAVMVGKGSMRVMGAAIAKWLNSKRLPPGTKINFQ